MARYSQKIPRVFMKIASPGDEGGGFSRTLSVQAARENKERGNKAQENKEWGMKIKSGNCFGHPAATIRGWLSI